MITLAQYLEIFSIGSLMLVFALTALSVAYAVLLLCTVIALFTGDDHEHS